MTSRSRWLAVTLSVAGVVLLILMTRIGCEAFETRVESYETMAAAEAAGAVERGWIPSFVPQSAVHIKEVHDSDTNAEWLQFTIAPEAVDQMVVAMSRMSLTEARETGVSRPWQVGRGWPPELGSALFATPLDSGRLGFFRSADGGYCLAVETHTGRIFAWSCGRVG